MRFIGLVLLLLGMAPDARLHAAECGPAGDPAPRREDWQGQRTWQALEAAGYTIREIRVVVDDVFELNPAGGPWYARGANFLHIDTRAGAIRDHLSMAPGDRVEARRIYEATRRLRALNYLREAFIDPRDCADGQVDLLVNVKDAWSLQASAYATSIGGGSTLNVEVSDSNILGSGKALALHRDHDVERTSTSVSWRDPNMFGTDWTLYARHASLSDGVSNYLNLALPFVHFDSPFSLRASFQDTKDTVSFYNRGRRAWHTTSEREIQAVDLDWLVRWDGDAGWRMGVRYAYEFYDYGPLIAIDASLRPPPDLIDREFRGIMWTVERYHDRYHAFRDLRLVGRVEDYNLGLNARLQLGYFPKEFGSSVQASMLRFQGTWAGRIGSESLLFWDGDFQLRHEDDIGARDNYGSTALTFYGRRYAPHTVVARLELDWRQAPDPEHELYIGGEQGLVGYDNHFRSGDRSWTLHLGDRVVGRHTLMRTFRVGYVAFVEAGQVRELDTGRWGKVYANLGAGFRLGNLRSAFGQVIYLTLAVPVVRDHGMPSYALVLGDVIDF